MLNEFINIMDDVDSILIIVERHGKNPPSVFIRTFIYDSLGKLDDFAKKYRGLIGKTTDYVWRSFLRLLKLKREEGLPLFMKKVNPPGYKKKSKQKMLWVVFRNDQYTIENDRIIIKRLGVIGRIEVRYKGLIHLEGVEGSLEIRHDTDSGEMVCPYTLQSF